MRHILKYQNIFIYSLEHCVFIDFLIIQTIMCHSHIPQFSV